MASDLYCHGCGGPGHYFSACPMMRPNDLYLHNQQRGTITKFDVGSFHECTINTLSAQLARFENAQPAHVTFTSPFTAFNDPGNVDMVLSAFRVNSQVIVGYFIQGRDLIGPYPQQYNLDVTAALQMSYFDLIAQINYLQMEIHQLVKFRNAAEQHVGISKGTQQLPLEVGPEGMVTPNNNSVTNVSCHLSDVQGTHLSQPLPPSAPAEVASPPVTTPPLPPIVVPVPVKKDDTPPSVTTDGTPPESRTICLKPVPFNIDKESVLSEIYFRVPVVKHQCYAPNHARIKSYMIFVECATVAGAKKAVSKGYIKLKNRGDLKIFVEQAKQSIRTDGVDESFTPIMLKMRVFLFRIPLRDVAVGPLNKLSPVEVSTRAEFLQRALEYYLDVGRDIPDMILPRLNESLFSLVMKHSKVLLSPESQDTHGAIAKNIQVGVVCALCCCILRTEYADAIALASMVPSGLLSIDLTQPQHQQHFLSNTQCIMALLFRTAGIASDNLMGFLPESAVRAPTELLWKHIGVSGRSGDRLNHKMKSDNVFECVKDISLTFAAVSYPHHEEESQ